MKPAAVRSGVALAVFAVWLGWLAYLALTTMRPIVLSRPQLLVSNLDVIAEVDRVDPAGSRVTVREVHWPPGEKLAGQQITVTNLAQCDGWTGPGQYILPLSPDGQNWQVTPTPRSPGYTKPGKPRIYPLTPETRRQLDDIHKPDVLKALR